MKIFYHCLIWAFAILFTFAGIELEVLTQGGGK